jgi:isopenicillin-N N-acyltransferase-like protein
MIAAEDAIVDVEVTPTGIGVLEAKDGVLGHANHFLSAEYRTAETDRLALPDSFPRQQRIDALLREHRDGLTVERMKIILSDHTNAPTGICRHEEPGVDRMVTAAALIAEPAAGRLHVSRGQPCRGDWTTYAL